MLIPMPVPTFTLMHTLNFTIMLELVLAVMLEPGEGTNSACSTPSAAYQLPRCAVRFEVYGAHRKEARMLPCRVYSKSL